LAASAVLVPGPTMARSRSSSSRVSISLAFGPLGTSTQVGAQLLAFPGGISAYLLQHPFRVGADPSDLGAGGLLARLSMGGFLPAPAPQWPRSRLRPGGTGPGQPP